MYVATPLRAPMRTGLDTGAPAPLNGGQGSGYLGGLMAGAPVGAICPDPVGLYCIMPGGWVSRLFLIILSTAEIFISLFLSILKHLTCSSSIIHSADFELSVIP